MIASKIDLTPGDFRAATNGKYSIQISSQGIPYMVDENNKAVPMAGTIDHSKLENRNISNQHSIESIKNLEERLDNILDNVPHYFSAISDVVQSFSQQAEIITEWDNVIVKHPKFIHSLDSPEEIQVNHTGFIQIWVKTNWVSEEKNRILVRTLISLDLKELLYTSTYSWSRHKSYINVTSNFINGEVIPVTKGQVLRVHSKCALNDGVEDLGDRLNNSSISGESKINIKTIVCPI